jgi:5,5'-dehydrodivanillate O-demethylase
MHFRVPIDDERTRIIWTGLLPEDPKRPHAQDEDDDVTFRYVRDTDLGNGEYDLSDFYGQDRAVWETMGTICDRSKETLGASDRGVVLYRRMLAEQIDRVARGEEPTVGIAREDENHPMIAFPSATKPWRDERFVGAKI